MIDRIHILLGKLPYIRRYRRSLELAFEILGPEGRKEFRKRRYA
jgi:hypothetical protein